MEEKNAIAILVQVAEMAQKNGLFDLKGASIAYEATQVLTKEKEVIAPKKTVRTVNKPK